MALTFPLSSQDVDRLASVKTFEQYLEISEEGKFEFVAGNVIPVEPPSEEHNALSGYLYHVTGVYVEETENGRVMGDNYTQQLGPETNRIPDVSFFRKDSLGKIQHLHSEGGADLIIEVLSPSTRRIDRGEKFYEYEAAGVEEYWMVDPERKTAEFYRLTDGRYIPVLPDAEGRVHSSTIPGFYLRVSWLWERPKITTVLRELGVL